MSDTSQARDRIVSLFAQALNLDVPSIDIDLFDSGILDSLLFVELLVHLEREFGLKTAVDDLEIDNFRSIACIAEFVTAHAPSHAGAAAPRVARTGQAR